MDENGWIEVDKCYLNKYNKRNKIIIKKINYGWINNTYTLFWEFVRYA